MRLEFLYKDTNAICWVQHLFAELLTICIFFGAEFCDHFWSLLQSLQFKRRGIFGRIVGEDFFGRILCYFWVCCNFCSSEEVAFVAELLHKILLQLFFRYFEFVAIFAVQKTRNLLQNFFCCFECVVAIFFAGCRIFVLFCVGVWNCSNLFCIFRRRDFAAEFCVVLKCVAAKKIAVQ